jgi:hypothetical protein
MNLNRKWPPMDISSMQKIAQMRANKHVRTDILLLILSESTIRSLHP